MMRLRLIFTVFFVIWLVLLGRVYYLSVQKSTHYGKLAQKNTIKTEALLPVRGTIYDSNGHPLAVNRLGFSISFLPHLSHSVLSSELEDTVDFLIGIDDNLGTKEQIIDRYRKLDSYYSHDPVEVISFVSYESILPYFSRLTLHPSIIVSPTTLRHYPNDKIASHILGYVSRADRKNRDIDEASRTIGFYGRAGVERFYNKALEGELGRRTYQVTAFNREIEEIERVEPSRDQDMVLYLDIRLQKFIHHLYYDSNMTGVALIMDLSNGGLVAAGSFPEYDINKFVTGISVEEWKEMTEDFNHPFINKMANSLYPPGSVIKPSVALSFLESGLITPSTEFSCSGSFYFANRDFRCWKKEGHKDVNLRKSLRESCDTYYYKAGNMVGIDQIASKLFEHGFGAKTGVDLSSEFAGIVPNPQWKQARYKQRWFAGETLNTAIGQGGFLASPLQVLTNTGLIATGKLYEPRFVKSIRNESVPSKHTTPLSESDQHYIKDIRQGMIDVTSANYGTALRAFWNLPIKVAGKTGTAQVVSIPQDEKERMSETEFEHRMRSHAWFTGYMPANDPKYAVVVLIEHGMSGGGVAAPLTARIVRKMNELGYFSD